MFEKYNNLFKLTALLIVTAMLFGMTFTVSAYEMDEALHENWIFNGGAYSLVGTSLITVLPENGQKAPKAEAMEARVTEEGGIRLIGPAPAVKGDYPFYAVTSKHTTGLAGLKVDVKLDEFTFAMDHFNVSNRIVVLWNENEAPDALTLDHPEMVYNNGLRYIIPYKKTEPGIPAAKGTQGRALYVEISNCEKDNKGQVATKVNIVYYDGNYINLNDEHPGYRWTFSGEYIDLTNGLRVEIVPDEEHGYIVVINGQEFYRGEDVAAFPEAIAKGKEYGGKGEYNGLKDIPGDEEKYLASMEYAKDDIDLTGLVGAEEGYLTVGVTGVYDKYCPENVGNITVKRINGYKAAEWKGEGPCVHAKGEWVTLVDATCGTKGERGFKCYVCEEIVAREEIDPIAENHVEDYKYDIYPTCEHVGYKHKVCKICGIRLGEDIEVPKTECGANSYIYLKKAKCEEDGLAVGKCRHCNKTLQVVVPATGHNYVEVIEKEAGYGVEGIKAELCENCADRRNETVIEPKYFVDVPEGAWYYDAVYHCAGVGYIIGNEKEEFRPEDKLTREQFVAILARVAGAELEGYEAGRFADVKDGTWYAGAVAWAAEEGYVKGVGDGRNFGVGNAITRQELAVMLFRYAEKAGVAVEERAKLDEYKDVERISTWAEDALGWAVADGILNSTSKAAKVLDPLANVTRAQAAQIFMNYDNIA